MPLVSVDWLREHWGDATLVVVDTRFVMGRPGAGRKAYREGHIPGAVFADLEGDLSLPVRPDGAGGRHPLPPSTVLGERLGALGVGSGDLVVAYDDPGAGNACYASHLWWVLRYLGHDRVRVLDGGLSAWRETGGALETGTAQRAAAQFVVRAREEMVVDADSVERRGPGAVLVDCRAGARYRGESEPLDAKAGHIPGALNVDWTTALEGGRWKPGEAQRERLAAVEGAGEAIFYCGSGVSATANLLAAELAGISGAKLYAGSWSDWVSDPRRAVAVGR